MKGDAHGLGALRLEDTVVIALAASRIARAVSIDEVTAPWRERLTQSAERRDGSTVRDRLHQRAADLIGCPVCTGWWASIATSLLWPGRYRLRRGVSVAGLQVLLTFAERLVSEQGRAAVEHADHLAAIPAGDVVARSVAAGGLTPRGVR